MAEPIVAQKAPYAKELEAGKTYYWCACGKSANQPFCDGKHKDTGLRARGLHRREERNRLSLRLQGHQERALLRRRAQEPVSRTRNRSKRGPAAIPPAFFVLRAPSMTRVVDVLVPVAVDTAYSYRVPAGLRSRRALSSACRSGRATRPASSGRCARPAATT